MAHKMVKTLSASRLQHARHLLDGYVNQGKLPGYSFLISQGGKEVAYFSQGLRDVARNQPLERDTLFRIYSMTKPVTSIALMQLYEQGRFLLNDPVPRYIPAWKDLKVFDQGTAASYTVKDPDRAMTIKDLLTHTSGLTYSFLTGHPLDELYRQHQIDRVATGLTVAGMIEKLATLPLQFSPGSRWNYSISTDIIGYLVEQISGQTLDDYFQQHIFAPLGMQDTAFHVPANKAERFASCYAFQPGKPYVLQDDPATSPFLQPQTFLSGGGGLVSTIDDYNTFAHALFNKGQYNSQRIIGSKTLEYMTCNHLPSNRDLAAMGQPVFSETSFAGVGFGLGFSVILNPAEAGVLTSAGDYGWGGMASTYFWVDPIEELVGVFMTQMIPSACYPLRAQLKAAVNQALC